jgi:hypothetical protein
MSTPEPAPSGTMKRTGRVGHAGVCARDGVAAPNQRKRRDEYRNRRAIAPPRDRFLIFDEHRIRRDDSRVAANVASFIKLLHLIRSASVLRRWRMPHCNSQFRDSCNFAAAGSNPTPSPSILSPIGRRSASERNRRRVVHRSFIA